MGIRLTIIGYVTALAREGFPGIYRAGRLWPGGQQVEVGVYDCEEDPAQVDGESLRIGLQSLKAIEEDPRISVKQTRAMGLEEVAAVNGALAADLSAAQVDNARLKAELEAMKESLTKSKK